MKRLVTVDDVIQPDPDDGSGYPAVRYAEVRLSTCGHKKLPPRAVTFPDGTVGNVTDSHQSDMTVKLRADQHADVIANLALLAADPPVTTGNPLANSEFPGDMWCQVHYR